MARRSLFFLLAVVAVLVAAVCAQTVDPTCATGIARGAACCPATCGQCGGSGCFKRSMELKTRCCSSGILNPALNVPSCNSAAPPCTISSSSPPPTVSKSPAPQGSDPTCSTGIERNGACCPSVCGVCGSSDCFQRSMRLGTRCCPSGILRPSSSVPSCDVSLPPCVLRRSTSPRSPTPTPSPSASASPAEGADPTCSTGILGNGACCRKTCGQCGGPRCGSRTRQFGTLCCIGAILNPANALPLCSDAPPPCRVAKTEPTPLVSPTPTVTPSPSKSTPPRRTPSPSQPSAIEGEWVTAEVTQGSLVARHEACAVMVNGLVVLLGGRGMKPVSVYDPMTRMWSRREGPGPGIMIHHFQCVAAGGSVWAATSWRGGFPFEENNEMVYEYDVAADVWRTHPGLPEPRRRGGAASVVRGDFIYVVAGNRGGHGAHAQALPWMDAFNWRTKQWSAENSFPDMPDAGRDHVSGSLVNDELCIAGGRDGGSATFFRANIPTTYCYNYTSKTWRQAADIPQKRAGANTATTCDGRMMVAGGEGDGRAYDRVDVFDGNKWTQGASLVQRRHSSGLAVSSCGCGHIFIPSGSGNLGGSPELTTTEEFIPVGFPANCSSY